MKSKQATTYLVTMPPPTPNGGLHLGHLAGPFLAADAFAKAMMERGDTAHVVSFSDSNQSYVRATAEKQDVDPTELASGWSKDIVETLDTYGCTLDQYFEPNSETNEYCRALFLDLYDKGLLKRKAYPFFYSKKRGEFMDEAGVSGLCPQCLDNCKCGICEHCGHINDANTLLLPYDTNSPDLSLDIHNVDVLVLELETWRNQLKEFHDNNENIRPKYKWLVDEALSKPLPDFPISVPGNWGIAMEHPHFPDQFLNAWPEILTNFMYEYETFETKNAIDSMRIVNFFGYDNSYFYAVVHVALLFAFGKENYLPYSTMTNEFYNLEQEKFSTSRNHVVWAKDIAKETLPDKVRLYAALSGPGYEKSNFSKKEMDKVIDNRFVEPWNYVAQKVNEITAQIDSTDRLPAISSDATELVAAVANRASKYYEIEHFSLRESSETIMGFLPAISHYIDSAKHTDKPLQIMADIAAVLDAYVGVLTPIAPVLASRIGGNAKAIRAGARMCSGADLFRHKACERASERSIELV